MVKQYGKEKAKSIFYASINKGKEGSSKWHKKATSYDGETVKKALRK